MRWAAAAGGWALNASLDCCFRHRCLLACLLLLPIARHRCRPWSRTAFKTHLALDFHNQPASLPTLLTFPAFPAPPCPQAELANIQKEKERLDTTTVDEELARNPEMAKVGGSPAPLALPSLSVGGQDACAPAIPAWLRAAHVLGWGATCMQVASAFMRRAAFVASAWLPPSRASPHSHPAGCLAVLAWLVVPCPACLLSWPQHALPPLACAPRLPGCRRLTRSCSRTTSWWSEQQHPQQAEQSQWHTQPAAHAASATAACTHCTSTWVQPLVSM